MWHINHPTKYQYTVVIKVSSLAQQIVKLPRHLQNKMMEIESSFFWWRGSGMADDQLSIITESDIHRSKNLYTG
jgi:hypothetical protein